MPIYEYRCLDNGHQFEEIQKISDPPITVCPTCQGKAEKIVSRTSFQLKGSGWFASDYKKSNTSTAAPTKSEASSDSSGSSDTSSSDSTKSENKSSCSTGCGCH